MNTLLFIFFGILLLGVAWLLWRLTRVDAEARRNRLGGSPPKASSGRTARLVKTGNDGNEGSANGKIRTCPLCATRLETGERVKSAVYPGKGEQMMNIFGCPHCYPAPSEAKRVCPVCGKEVPRDGHVIARMFRKPGYRDHVHVLGCTGCRKAR